jgi:hypothetical protein
MRPDVAVLALVVRGLMKNKIKYTSKPLRKLRVVDDFLPAPKKLVFKGARHAKRRAASSVKVDGGIKL